MINLTEDFSFDPLTDGGGPFDPGARDDEAVNAENRAHAALFAHVGVTDPADWRTVALRLACQYAPQVLVGDEQCRPAPPKKGGRPEKWSDNRLWMLATFIEMVRERSRSGQLRPGFDLDTNINACKFIAGPYPETQWMRDALGLRPGISPGRLDNLRREAVQRVR